MDVPAAAVTIAKSRRWATWRENQRRCYELGLDAEGEPCRLQITGASDLRLAVAWRTVDGQWLGRFRYDDGYATTRLSAIDIELVENVAKMLHD